MANLAIIPARGGSKRIARKNVKDFLGKPIISYSILAAINSNLFDEVMVSTDDSIIAEIAKEYGATVPFLRSEHNSDDFATTLSVLQEVESSYKKNFNKLFDFICCIYPTAPLITSANLFEGYQILRDKQVDVVFPVVEFSYPIWRGLELNDDRAKMVWPEYITARSQDLKSIYHDAGQWYWYDPLKIQSTLFTPNAGVVILDETRVQDIDRPTDWMLAELKYKLLNH